MAEAGILSDDDRVELIEGEIVRLSPIGTRHAACVDRLTALLARRLGSRAIVRVQGPIVLSDITEPQPDLSILRRRKDFYATRHPSPGDTVLVVEVADTSGEYDRGTKLPLYALAGIPEVWVVDVRRNVLEVYRRPALRAYRQRRELARGGRVSPSAFPHAGLRVSDFLG
jgi:Uma2 family endonuclease